MSRRFIVWCNAHLDSKGLGVANVIKTLNLG